MKSSFIFVGVIGATATFVVDAPTQKIYFSTSLRTSHWTPLTPTPSPSTLSDVSTDTSPAPSAGKAIVIDGLSENSTGDDSVSVGVTKDKAAASSSGQEAALAAAIASPGAPTALGLAF